MMRTLRLLNRVRVRTVRTTLRERGWAQRTVIFLFLLVGAAVFLGAFFFFARTFSFIAAEPFVGPVVARFVLESSLHAVFLLGVASFVSVAVRFMFMSDEVRFLAPFPIRPETLFAYRMIGATAVSSWPVVFLAVPAMVAFGNALEAGPAFYAGAGFVLLLFVLATAVVGALATFLIAPLFCRCRARTRFLIRIVGFVAFALLVVRTTVPRGIFGDFLLISDAATAVERTARIRQWFLFSPSRPFADLLSSVLPFGMNHVVFTFSVTAAGIAGLTALLFAVARRRYLRLVQLHGETGFLARPDDVGPAHPRHTFPSIFKWRHGFLFEKDLLSFFRDPEEVSRALFLGVLMLLYVFAARGVMELDVFEGATIPPGAVTFAFGAIGYFCLAFALRFVFPTLSREGRSAWVFWSSPVHVHEFFSWKLFFWSFMTALTACTAAVLSVLLFRLPVVLGGFFLFASFCASIGIVAIALGQGSMYADTREDDPDVLSTTPAGLATTGLGLLYLLIVGRYVHTFAARFLATGGHVGLLDGFGILIVTVCIVAVYWILAPRSMEARELG